MEVHVFVFEHRHGRAVTAHASAEVAYAAAAEIARRDWAEARQLEKTLPASPPADDVEAVELYFEAQQDLESYEIVGCEVEGAAPAAAEGGSMDSELERQLAAAAEDHSTQAMALTAQAARAHGWRAIATTEEEVRAGTRQIGCALVSRAGSRFLIAKAERAYAVLTWIYRCEDGIVFFEGGEYDLTRSEALERFVARSRLPLPVPAGAGAL